MPKSISSAVLSLIDLALSEDVGTGDVTTESLIDNSLEADALIYAKEDLVLAGLEIAKAVFSKVDEGLSYKEYARDSSFLKTGNQILSISGCYASILTAERVALNFLQKLSGIASQTSKLVQMVGGTGVSLMDTRKTTPGFRELEKYAVNIGGGVNHRVGLYDAFLIKDNHIDVLGGDVALAIRKAKENNPKGLKLQVEVRDEKQLRTALAEGVDAILLDNMDPEELTRAVELARKLDSEVSLEASGNINQSNITEYARTGVDYISMGALTHSVAAADISLVFSSRA